MPGHNHHADCTCGWCLKLGTGRTRAPVISSRLPGPSFKTYDSFTTPNASCPVCGANVFFYQSVHGSRVFFDELGPPWPKHPCTDNSSVPVGRPATNVTPRPSPTWQKQGWEPVIIRSSRFNGMWHSIACENLATRTHFVVLSGYPVIVRPNTCAFLKPWDSNGWSEIEFIELDRASSPSSISVFEQKRHSGTSRWWAVEKRKRAQGH